MSGQLPRLNLQSKEYTGTKTFSAAINRGYFFIVVTVGEATMSLGGGDGEIPLVLGQHYEPYVTPTGEIKITEVTGVTYVVVTNVHNAV